jgi:hypothetical protein
MNLDNKHFLIKLTECGSFLLEELIVAQLVNKFPAFCRTQSTIVRVAANGPSGVKQIPVHTLSSFYLRSILILFSHVYRPGCIFPSSFYLNFYI